MKTHKILSRLTIILLCLKSMNLLALYLQSTEFNPLDKASASIHLERDSKKNIGFLRIHSFNQGSTLSIIDFSDGKNNLSQLRGVDTPSGSLHSAVSLDWICFLGLYHPDCLNNSVDGVLKQHAYESLFLNNTNGFCRDNASRTIAQAGTLTITCKTEDSAKDIILNANQKVRIFCMSADPYDAYVTGQFGAGTGIFRTGARAFKRNPASISCSLGDNIKLSDNPDNYYNKHRLNLIFSTPKNYTLQKGLAPFQTGNARMVFVRK